MKVNYQFKSGVGVELEATNQKEIFESLAMLEEIFGVNQCERCQGTSLKFVVREIDGNKYYETHCCNTQCRARLAFGSHKTGNTLFPKRKDDEGKWLKYGGWQIWDSVEKKMK